MTPSQVYREYTESMHILMPLLTAIADRVVVNMGRCDLDTTELVFALADLKTLPEGTLTATQAAQYRWFREYIEGPRFDQDPRISRNTTIAEMLAVAHFYTRGTHVIQIDQRTTDAFANMDLPIYPAEYHQPYMCVGVQTPADFVLLLWAPAPCQIVTLVVLLPAGEGNDVFLMPVRSGDTMDQALSDLLGTDSRATTTSLRSLRVAMNVAMYATVHGLTPVVDNMPYRERLLRRLDKAVKAGNTALQQANQKELLLSPQRFKFDQQVPLFRTTHSTDAGSTDAAGRTMPPHWRRGHWRRQHYGTGRSQVKLIPIPAVLVNADLLLGDVSLSSVTYS
jgi:hypothetical protein